MSDITSASIRFRWFRLRTGAAGAWIATVMAMAMAMEPETAFDLPADGERPDTVAFSSDLACLAMVQPSGKVEVLDLASQQRIAGWVCAAGSGGAASPFPTLQRRATFFPGTRRLLVAQGTNLAVYNATNGALLTPLDPAPASIRAVTISADGRRAAAFTGLATVFWNVETGRRLTALPSGSGLAFQTARRTMSHNGPKPTRIPASDAMALSADGRALAVDKGHGEVDLWHFDDGAWSDYLVSDLGLPPATSVRATDLAYLPDGRLAAIFMNANLVLFRRPDEPPQRLLVQEASGAPERLELHSLAVSDDGRSVAAGGILAGARPGLDPTETVYDSPREAELRVWDVTTLTEVARLPGRPGEVAGAVALDSAGRRVAAVSGAGFARLVTGTLQKLPRPPGAVAAPPGSPLRVAVWRIRND